MDVDEVGAEPEGTRRISRRIYLKEKKGGAEMKCVIITRKGMNEAEAHEKLRGTNWGGRIIRRGKREEERLQRKGEGEARRLCGKTYIRRRWMRNMIEGEHRCPATVLKKEGDVHRRELEKKWIEISLEERKGQSFNIREK